MTTLTCLVWHNSFTGGGLKKHCIKHYVFAPNIFKICGMDFHTSQMPHANNAWQQTLSLFSCHIVDIRPGQRLMQISLDLNIRQMVIKLQTILIYGCGMDFHL